MPHEANLIATIAASFGLALIAGLACARLRIPPIVGYLLAGVAIGPATPGFVADIELAAQLAEVGVMLLMFGVGLHFSLSDLLAVKRIAIPGAVLQIAVATGLGMGLALSWGWSLGAGLIFGIALSVASTVVLIRALEARGMLSSINGQRRRHGVHGRARARPRHEPARPRPHGPAIDAPVGQPVSWAGTGPAARPRRGTGSRASLPAPSAAGAGRRRASFPSTCAPCRRRSPSRRSSAP